jgi:hypothetical protein
MGIISACSPDGLVCFVSATVKFFALILRSHCNDYAYGPLSLVAFLVVRVCGYVVKFVIVSSSYIISLVRALLI